MAEEKISPELKAELERLRLAEAVQRIRVMIEIEPRILTLEEATETLIVQYGAEIIYKSTVTNYVSLIVNSDKVYAIAAQPWVKRIWHVPEVRLLEIPILPGEILAPEELAQAATVTLMETAEYIGVKRVKEKGYDGTGIKIAVVDTGIEKTHPMLEGQVIAEKNFTSEPDANDYHGHGTWTASCNAGKYWISPVGPLEGMAPGAKLINAKIFDASGRTTIDVAMAALEWACEQGAHILSNSWGNNRYDPIRDLITTLKEKYGVIFVFAAGNSGPDSGTIGYPGGYPEVVCVGSVAVKNPAADTVADFSSRGPNWQGDVKPDIMAPGGNGGGGYDECIYAAYIDGGVKCWRGTSMATPHIAGGLALVLQAGVTPDIAVEHLYTSARDIYAPGKDNDSGFGVADFAAALELPPPVYYVLTVNSEPITVNFYVDEKAFATPWSGELREGKHTVSMPSRLIVGEALYVFARWEDGSTNSSRVVDLIKPTVVTAYYQVIPSHILTVDSSPVIGVTFTVDNVAHTTPYSERLEEGSHIIVVPTRIVVDSVTYDFVKWEDGGTEATRTVNLVSDMKATAFYEEVPKYSLLVDSEPFEGITFWIDDTPYSTPSILKRLRGTYTIAFPREVTINGQKFAFLEWEDGSKDPTRTLNLTSDMKIVGRYETAHSLTVKSTPVTGVPVSLDAYSIGVTSVTTPVSEDSHTISVPEEIEV